MAQSDGSMNKRSDGRSSDALREIKFTRGWLNHAEGSVIVEFGQTRVLCAASFTAGVPRWMAGQGKGWDVWRQRRLAVTTGACFLGACQVVVPDVDMQVTTNCVNERIV